MKTFRILYCPHNESLALGPTWLSLSLIGGKHWEYTGVPTPPHTLPEQSKDWDPQAASCKRGRREDGTAEIPNEARGNWHVKVKLQAAVWLQTKQELASSGPPHGSRSQNMSVGPKHARMRTHTHHEVNRASEKESWNGQIKSVRGHLPWSCRDLK